MNNTRRLARCTRRRAIPTLAPRLNGPSIANVAASSHSYDLNRRRCAVTRSPAWPAGGARRSTRAPRARRWPPPSPTPPGHRRAAGRPFSRCVARRPTWWNTAARTRCTPPTHALPLHQTRQPWSTVPRNRLKTQCHAPELFRKSTSGGKLPDRRRRAIHPAPPTPRIMDVTSGPNPAF